MTVDEHGLPAPIAGGFWWTRFDAQLDGTWAVWESLGLTDETVVARCSSFEVASHVARHCPAAVRYAKEKAEA